MKPAKPWEVAHIAFAVDDVEKWMITYGRFLPGRWTSVLEVDHEWEAPMRGGQIERIVGRAVWRSGQEPPLEVWEGPEGSPWHVPAGVARIDHIGYWASDMPAQARCLQEAGFEIEYTMPRDASREIVGFAYFRHPNGFRVELQVDSDRESHEQWLVGNPLDLEWGGFHAP